MEILKVVFGSLRKYNGSLVSLVGRSLVSHPCVPPYWTCDAQHVIKSNSTVLPGSLIHIRVPYTNYRPHIPPSLPAKDRAHNIQTVHQSKHVYARTAKSIPIHFGKRTRTCARAHTRTQRRR